MPERILRTLEDTRRLGVLLGRTSRQGDVILLTGQLGAGKTTLAQFIAEGLDVPAEYYVTSPSFSLVHEYPGRIPLYHIDCYRLDNEDDVEESGLMDYIAADGLTVVEWPDRLGSLVPAERLDMEIRLAGGDVRVAVLTPHGESWRKRMDELTGGANLPVRDTEREE
jgi:tRNA threonylcarbamoyladenosine biosynthesis protein TsaE